MASWPLQTVDVLRLNRGLVTFCGEMDLCGCHLSRLVAGRRKLRVRFAALQAGAVRWYQPVGGWDSQKEVGPVAPGTGPQNFESSGVSLQSVEWASSARRCSGQFCATGRRERLVAYGSWDFMGELE